MPSSTEHANGNLAMLEGTHAAINDLLHSVQLPEALRLYAEHTRLLLAYEIAALRSGRKAAAS